MKGCLDYRKEASRRRLKLPEISRRTWVFLILVSALVGAVFLWSALSDTHAQGFELQSASDKEPLPPDSLADIPPVSQTPESLSEKDDSESPSMTDTPAKEGLLVVYISGAVHKPGVYELSSGARIDDGVTAAGGFTEEAAGGYVNLAALLTDGQQIHIPTREELLAGTTLPSQASRGEAPASTSAPSGSAQAVPQKVNINSADSTTLETLPGIGPATAQRIIAYREAHGPFADIGGLKQVSGIGEKKYAALADLICVG